MASPDHPSTTFGGPPPHLRWGGRLPPPRLLQRPQLLFDLRPPQRIGGGAVEEGAPDPLCFVEPARLGQRQAEEEARRGMVRRQRRRALEGELGCGGDQAAR